VKHLYVEHTSAYVSIRQHTSAYVSIRQHTPAYVSIRQHTSAYGGRARGEQRKNENVKESDVRRVKHQVERGSARYAASSLRPHTLVA
jgi:hypothetical protein